MIYFDIYEETNLVKILLVLWDKYQGEPDTLRELYKVTQYGFDVGGEIYDTNEYMREQIMILDGELEASDDSMVPRKKAESEVKRIYEDEDISVLTAEDKKDLVRGGKFIYEDIKTDPEKLANYAAFLHLIDKANPQPVDEFNNLVQMVEEQIKTHRETERPHSK